MCVYPFITLVSCFVYFWCAGSVRISLAGWVIYFCVGLRCVECRAGTILFGHFLGADGGTVQIFPSFWICCSGYGMVEMVRGVVRLFLLSSICFQFSWRLDVCGRIFVLYILFSLVDLWYFLAVPNFFKLVIFLNSLQVVQAESELGGPGTSA